MISDLGNKAALTASAGARLISGVGTILVLATVLPTSEYGLIVTVLAVGQIVGILSSFGFSVQLLRDVGEDSSIAGRLLTLCIRAKNILALIIGGIVIIGAQLIGVDYELLGAAAIVIFLSAIVSSYNELAVQTLKGLQRFKAEAFNALFGHLLYFAIILGVALAIGDVFAIAVAMLAARTAQLVASLFLVGRHAALGNPVWGKAREMFDFAKRSAEVGLDGTLTAVAAQIDVVLVSAIFGLETVGAYQIISRIAVYAMIPAQVLIAAFVPRMAATSDRAERRKIGRQMQLEFALLGAVAAAAIIALYYIVPYVLEDSYRLAWPIWIGFAVLLFTKFNVAALGVFLVVAQKYRERIVAQLANSTIIIAGFALALPLSGVIGAPVILLAAYLATGAIYVWGLKRGPKPPLQST